MLQPLALVPKRRPCTSRLGPAACIGGELARLTSSTPDSVLQNLEELRSSDLRRIRSPGHWRLIAAAGCCQSAQGTATVRDRVGKCAAESLEGHLSSGR
jgi:hypothetical protein